MSTAFDLSQAELEAELGFATDEDSPIPYMKRTRDWYLALGYGNPYRWAHYREVPFRPLSKPLAQCNAAGRPNDPESQALTLELALRVLEFAPGPRTTMQSPLRWSESHAWKLDYSNVERVSPDELARRRTEFDKAKEAAKAIRASTP